MVQFIASEICRKPDYTRYMNTPLTQNDVNYNLMAFSEKTEYSRLVAELYLPALATSLDLHLRVIQNIAGYYGVMNTLPLPNEGNPKEKKTVTLILVDGTYHPVVQTSEVSGLPTTDYSTIKAVSSSQYPVILMDEEEAPEVLVAETQLDSSHATERPHFPSARAHSTIVIPESQEEEAPQVLVAETQLDNTPCIGIPHSPPARLHSTIVIPESPDVTPQSPVVNIQPIQPEPELRRGIKRRILSQTATKKSRRTTEKGIAENLIIISSDSETDTDASPVFYGGRVETPQPHSSSRTHENRMLRELQIMDQQLKVKEEEEEEIPDITFCPEVSGTGRRVTFNMKPFWGMIPEVVNKLPHDIDGVKFYIIDVPREEAFHTRYRDGRHFQMHSSSRKGFQEV